MLPDGTYERRMPADPSAPKDCHQAQIEHAERAYKSATRLRARKPSGLPKRPLD
jgi:hypothetical protein